MPDADATATPAGCGPRPRVSLGMPVYNGAEHLAEALDSLLAQTFRDFELIICDNASSDATPEIARAYAERDPRIRYVRNAKNLGASPNFNKAFALARGEFFKWAAHDDLHAPTYLEACVRTFDESAKSVVLVFPRRLLLSHEGQPLGPDPRVRWVEAGPPYDRISFARLNRVPGLLFPILVFGLIRSAALRKTRLIEPYNHADLVLVGELRLLGEFREVPAPLFFTRLHKLTDEFGKERRTYVGEARWYDTARPTDRLSPEYNLLRQRLISVRRAELPLPRRIWCYGSVVFGQFVTRFPGWVAGRLRAAAVRMWRAWERCSVAAVRRSGRWQLPHRAWLLLSALRHREGRRVVLACSWPTAATRAALHAFVRERIMRRRDPHAAALAEEWKSREAAAPADGTSASAVDPTMAPAGERR